ncbi:UNVERIFIED_CONTAM: hypothetical protein Slati_2511400 [Sesamum latifolium]|uniref:Retrotransposon gag domain-containing protein n=1 Tax=Sesamum latifolium TaxID=2727402 RepID=A0AAW2WEW5_9LAMI
MENPANVADKQKTPDAPASTQALQVVTGVSPAPTVTGPPTATLAPAASLPRVQIVSAAVREQVAALAPVRIATPSNVEAPEEEPGEAVPALAPPTIRRPDIHSSVPQEFPANWLARLECLQKGLQDVQYQIGGALEEERQGVPFTELVMADDLPMNCRTLAIAEYDGTTDPVEHLARFENAALLHRYTDDIKCRVFVTTFARAAQTWFNQLPAGAIGSFQEFRLLFLHQFASSRKLRKTELSLFAVRQKDNEPLKEYLQRFNTAALEVPSATQEVKASAFSQGLLDEDFFKSLAKKPVSKFDALLARAAKYINMEDAQATKKESRGEKRRTQKKKPPPKKPRTDFRERKVSYQRINAVYTPMTCLSRKPSWPSKERGF